MEVSMVKIILVVIATAFPAFGAGIWTATQVEHQRTEISVVGSRRIRGARQCYSAGIDGHANGG
jgi:hypothetical protein